MPSSMHNVIVLAHVIILSFMCACCKANLIIIIIILTLSAGITPILIFNIIIISTIDSVSRQVATAMQAYKKTVGKSSYTLKFEVNMA